MLRAIVDALPDDPEPAGEGACSALDDALMHPNGRCTCCGEGRCEWCKRTAVGGVNVPEQKPAEPFKAGDRVRCVEAKDFLTKGKMYTVDEVMDHGLIEVVSDDGTVRCWLSERFELAEPIVAWVAVWRGDGSYTSPHYFEDEDEAYEFVDNEPQGWAVFRLEEADS